MNSRKCVICNIVVLRASYVKHLRGKKHLENEKHNEMTIPEWFFQEPVDNKIKNIYNPKSLTQIARDNIKSEDKQLHKQIAKNMPNPYYFSEKNLNVGFKINIDSHHINHAISKLTFIPNYPGYGIEVRYINKIIKELSVSLLD